MPVLGVEYDVTEEEAERRVANGNGEVTDEGNYYREEEVPMTVYENLRDHAEDDPEASITKFGL